MDFFSLYPSCFLVVVENCWFFTLELCRIVGFLVKCCTLVVYIFNNHKCQLLVQQDLITFFFSSFNWWEETTVPTRSHPPSSSFLSFIFISECILLESVIHWRKLLSRVLAHSWSVVSDSHYCRITCQFEKYHFFCWTLSWTMWLPLIQSVVPEDYGEVGVEQRQLKPRNHQIVNWKPVKCF